MMAPKFEVLVVGAGPAGTSASFFLKRFDSQQEFNVTLIDKLPEEKYSQYQRMCGEGISIDAFKELSPLAPAGIIHKIKLTEESYPGGIVLETPSNGYLLNRYIFLRDIQKKFVSCGGIIKTKAVIDFLISGNKIRVKFDDSTTALFDYVVAADGPNSLFRKNLGINAKGLCIAIQYIVDKPMKTDTIKFIYDEKYKGEYSWEFPNEDTAKVGFPILPNKPLFLPASGKILQKHVRPIGFGGVEKYVVSNILLVGDAACQTNALTKGGIRPALVSGRLAATALWKKDPQLYESNWLKTPYANPIFYSTYLHLSGLGNGQLTKMSQHFLDQKLSKDELELLKVFDLCDKFGW